MDLMQRLAPFTPLDAAAVGWLLIAWLGISWLIEHPPASRPSVSILMEQYRRDWMHEFVTREPRIFDATVIDSLRQGTAFFTSACMIVLGGGIALLGNTDRLVGLAQELTLTAEARAVELRVLLVLLFVANGFLKFIWAHRLFGFCAVLMAAVPNDPAHAMSYHRAAQSAEINIAAARSFNRGMRSVYFALGALGWLISPVALIVTATATLGVLTRREFLSHSRKVMLRHEG